MFEMKYFRMNVAFGKLSRAIVSLDLVDDLKQFMDVKTCINLDVVFFFLKIYKKNLIFTKDTILFY